jgi:hypothetical protein
MRSERQLRTEYGLTLKTSALPDEQVVEVALKRLFVDIEDFTAEVKTQGSV